PTVTEVTNHHSLLRLLWYPNRWLHRARGRERGQYPLQGSIYAASRRRKGYRPLYHPSQRPPTRPGSVVGKRCRDRRRHGCRRRAAMDGEKRVPAALTHHRPLPLKAKAKKNAPATLAAGAFD